MMMRRNNDDEDDGDMQMRKNMNCDMNYLHDTEGFKPPRDNLNIDEKEKGVC